MAKHEWRERTESGEQRSVRASHHAGKWTFEARLKSEPSWTLLDPVPLDDLRELLDVIERKYQRGRLPHDQIVKLRELIEEREELEGPGD